VYEFHGWVVLAESAEESDVGGLGAALDEVRARLEGSGWPPANAVLGWRNGRAVLTLEGAANRPGAEAGALDELLGFVAARLPGSYGLLYERDDERIEPPGPNAFRVRVLARGEIRDGEDPFLSPCRPVIED
jgi:hypothetical protein